MTIRFCILGLLVAVFTFTASAQHSSDSDASFRKMEQDAYQVGEKLHYRIRYGIINAGIAQIGIEKKTWRQGRQVFHIVATGRSVGMAEWFFRTRDRYETFFDVEALMPWEFIRDVDEGGYTKDYHLMLNQRQHTVKDINNLDKGVFDSPPYVQDMLSALYYARALNTDTLQAGELIEFPMFLDHEEFPFRLRLLGRETVDTKIGSLKCLVLRPSLQKGRVFKDKESMTIYVSDDANKVPVLIQSELRVGSIKVELTDAEGLRHGNLAK